MKRYWFLIAGLGLAAVVYAAQSTYRLVINGKPVEGSAIVFKGETYIPLKALQAARRVARAVRGTLQRLNLLLLQQTGYQAGPDREHQSCHNNLQCA